MKFRPLGRTDVMVSDLCLGSMTWGSQNTMAEGHAQIDRALDAGINFIDTAEMYPVNPVRAETIGRSEEVIGEWFARTGRRDAVILATKITGEGQRMVRDGAPITPQTLREAITGSLRRLKTDTIDLYQLHWPNRGSFHFRKQWHFDATGQARDEPGRMLDVLEEVGRQVKAGRIRHFGLSNESTWGTGQWLRLAETHDLPRVVSIQNEYSLLCRHFDTDLAEMSHHDSVGLLAFSPLAAGLLTGKYGPEQTPPGSRRSFNPTLGGRITPRVWPAVAAYHEIARRHGLDPVQMALAWVRSRPFVTSAIFGATSQQQLEHALGAADLELEGDVLHEIDLAHRTHPAPY